MRWMPRLSPSFGPKFSFLKVDRCLQHIIDRSLLLGLWASVSTGPLFFLFCYFFLSSCLDLVFHREMSRPRRPGTTIARSVDPRHMLLCPSSNAFRFPKVDRRWRLIVQ